MANPPTTTEPAVDALPLTDDPVALRKLLVVSAYNGDLESVEAILKKGTPIDTMDEKTGLSALHVAVGRNDLAMTKFLVESGASFAPDKQGRWPTTIAAVCEVSEELCDYIAEAEAAATATSD